MAFQLGGLISGNGDVDGVGTSAEWLASPAGLLHDVELAR
jgi:hypothetical protein